MLFLFQLISAEYQNIIEINHICDVKELTEGLVVNAQYEFMRCVYQVHY